MLKILKRHMLPITVFITGACVLVIEIVATRVLSPFYGNTIYSVSSVISVILAALSAGYYVGGSFADRHPSFRWFFSIILLSSVTLLFFHAIGTILLPLIGYVLPLTIGPLVFSVLLFFPPAFLLGTLSPYAVKLQSDNFPEQGVGSVSGTIFFWSTLGSIIGSLSAGFVFIPHFGINQILIADGVVLFCLGALPLVMMGKKKFIFSALLVVLLFSASAFLLSADTTSVYSKDGTYEKITIYDGEYGGRPTRFFKQDLSNSGAMYLDSDDLVYDYTKYYVLYKLFKPEIANVLVIGGGAYSIPKALLKDLPEATIDVSEIEPSLHMLAQEYFKLPQSDRLHNYTDDGRRLLHDTDKKYDFIFSDVYYSLFSIPSHFTTIEFFTTAKEKLSEDGIFVGNLIGDLSRQEPSLIMSEIKTFQTVFPNSYFFAVDSPTKIGSQNIIFVGYNSAKKMNFNDPQITTHEDEIIRVLGQKEINLDRFELSEFAVLSDNFAPVEDLTKSLLQRTLKTADRIDGNEMLATISQQLRYGPRYLGSDGHTRMQNFLTAEMMALAPNTKVQSWQHTSSDGQPYQLKNIIGSFNPENANRIIIASHYDSKKYADRDKKNTDNPVPGANDSASGVAVLVELAKLLANPEQPLNLGIDIVFFDGEEGDPDQRGDYSNWKPLGSTYFAEHLDEVYPLVKPASGVVLDMVCDKNLRIDIEPSSEAAAPTQAQKFRELAQRRNPDIFTNSLGPTIRDDHTSLTSVDIPSFLVIDFDYPYFHTTKDTADKCSADSLRTIAEAVLEYVSALSAEAKED